MDFDNLKRQTKRFLMSSKRNTIDNKITLK